MPERHFPTAYFYIWRHECRGLYPVRGGYYTLSPSLFGQWQEFELDLLEQLAVQIAIAIQQAKAFEQIQTELVERQRVEKALQQLAGELELRVQNRTVVLANAITTCQECGQDSGDGIGASDRKAVCGSA